MKLKHWPSPQTNCSGLAAVVRVVDRGHWPLPMPNRQVHLPRRVRKNEFSKVCAAKLAYRTSSIRDGGC